MGGGSVVPVPHRMEHGADACVSRESVSSSELRYPSGALRSCTRTTCIQLDIWAWSSDQGCAEETHLAANMQDKPCAGRAAAE